MLEKRFDNFLISQCEIDFTRGEVPQGGHGGRMGGDRGTGAGRVDRGQRSQGFTYVQILSSRKHQKFHKIF